MEISKKKGMYVGYIEDNLGTERSIMYYAQTIMDLIKKAFKENPKETMPIMHIKLHSSITT